MRNFKTDISGCAGHPIGENAIKNENVFEHLSDASFFVSALNRLTGRTDGAVLNFWFVLFQDKMNEGKQLTSCATAHSIKESLK